MLSKPEMNLYIVHQALIIISPVLLAIVEYITLGKLLALGQLGLTRQQSVSSGGSKGSCFTRPFSTAVKWAFTLSDVFCLLLQSSGGAMYPNNAAMARVLLLGDLACPADAVASAELGGYWVLLQLARAAKQWVHSKFNQQPVASEGFLAPHY
jgi:hypothetical protein